MDELAFNTNYGFKGFTKFAQQRMDELADKREASINGSGSFVDAFITRTAEAYRQFAAVAKKLNDMDRLRQARVDNYWAENLTAMSPDIGLNKMASA